ncbi:MAG: hypothetical protein ACRDKS_01835 [Actinomycetota bacterium]
MNVPFAIGGALALAGAAVHGAIGERLVVTKLRTEVLSPTPFGGPRMTKLMIRATWHITTLAFVVIGSAMAACTTADSSQACRGIGRVAAISYTSFAGLTIGLGVATRQGLGVATRQGPRALLRHPAPLLFALVAGLAWWGGAS